MSVSDFKPAVASFSMHTREGGFFVQAGEKVLLIVDIILAGLTLRTLPTVHEEPDDFVVTVTLMKQRGGIETVIIRQLYLECEAKDIDVNGLKQVSFGFDVIEDWKMVNFVDTFYFLWVSVTSTPPSDGGISDDLFYGKLIDTKVPFTLRGSENGC
ncbi:hypothetical protein HB818_14660 [Listeria booriae]|uniref:hypothetical protein n=1 Tax=Listeria booriae TaxID=1552123 RepID=UPI0016241A15|nr:hypothetical protein [Listeria booriae]MBC1287000.1 hypothetical protein [Listeria booriae]